MTDIAGNPLVMADDFGSIGFGTLEPGNGTNEEQISFTNLVNNSDGTTTLTGVSNVSFLYPYTQTSGLAKTHAGSTSFVISNTSGFYDKLTSKSDDETITGNWTFTGTTIVPDPVGLTEAANKEYVLSVVSGGPVSLNALIVAGTAGETVAAGNVLYLKVADGRWWKADADLTATVDNTQLGIAQGAGTAGVAITGGVLIEGVDTHQSGGTVGINGYVSNTPGNVSTSAGTITRVVGQFQSTTNFYFNPTFFSLPTATESAALVGTGGTPSSSNKYVTQSTAPTIALTPITRIYTSSGTWTKPAGIVAISIELWGGGGSGAARSTTGSAGGGGGGGYARRVIPASVLGSTVAYVVGTGGTGISGNTSGNDGTASNFGTFATAYAGGGGQTSGTTSTGGGGAAGLFSSATGTTSGAGITGFTNSTAGVTDVYVASAGGSVNTNPVTSVNTVLGGSGGAAVTTGNAGAAGISVLAGSGGACNVSGNATAGGFPSGGGGGSLAGGSGAGGNGQIILIEYYQ